MIIISLYRASVEFMEYTLWSVLCSRFHLLHGFGCQLPVFLGLDVVLVGIFCTEMFTTQLTHHRLSFLLLLQLSKHKKKMLVIKHIY